MNLYHDSKISRLVEQALHEDIGFGDVTSESLIAEDQQGRATVEARESGIVSGLELLNIVYGYIDPGVTITLKTQDGNVVAPGQPIAEIDGSVRSILMGERVALNFLQRMSGIASMTHQYVHAVSGTRAKITDTRKTVPGLRMLDKKAVTDGGGISHRFGLDDMVLIKDNHIAAAGGITAAIEQCRKYLSAGNIRIKVEIETSTIAEVEEAMRCGGFDRIMLDNFNLEDMNTAVALINHRVEVEASGGVTLKTVRAIAETGVDIISIGALTHSPRALDLSLEVHK